MEMTITNVLLIIAMVAVAMRFGYIKGHNKGYNGGKLEGFVNGVIKARTELFREFPDFAEVILAKEKEEGEALMRECEEIEKQNAE